MTCGSDASDHPGADGAPGPGLAVLPPNLSEEVTARWRAFAGRHPEAADRLAAAEPLASQLPRVWAGSEFVAETLLRYPELVEEFCRSGDLERAWHPGDLEAEGRALLEGVDSEAGAMAALRGLRRREMVRIAWRDLAGLATLRETLGHLSELAEICIRAAAGWAHSQLAVAHGEPRSPGGEPQRLLVIAMGKLGGRELNFSSDIDLVFLFPEAGETDGNRCLSNEQFFTRVGQMLIRLLDQRTEDGIAYRVDMRLRPFGDSGPLVMSLAAFGSYLQKHGRAWERYAYVKARPVTGHVEGMGLYRDILRPFVFRRYLDYGLVESLRDMKARIAAEVARRDLENNIKLGPGGIREIEFVVQCLQLLRGGADPRLREPGLPAALQRLGEAGLLPSSSVTGLQNAWAFLRRLENRLQEWQDRQTHELPGDEAGRARLACAMGYDDWPALASDLADHRQQVTACFEEQTAQANQEDDGLERLWTQDAEESKAHSLLAAAGFGGTGRALEAIRALARAGWFRRMDETGRERLKVTVPALIRAAAGLPHPEDALERLLKVVSAIGGRSAYYALLNENPAALARFASLCGRSEFLANQVALHPLLLDDLMDARILDQVAGREALARDLEGRLEGLEPDDLELQMEALRNFQRAAVFRTAVADLSGGLPLMKVSDQLTWIAEVVLEACIDLARRQTEVRHGQAVCGPSEEALRPCGFAVIGYGKLGGLELGYGSDLDLVFVHDAEGEIQKTTGPDEVDASVFFARMTRRLVHLLATPTAAGVLYEVDTRLRPSGKGGLLVTSLAALESYQRDQAWTWEHQALLRARAVAGDTRVRDRFEALRRRVLLEVVHRDRLKEEVAAMRARMREELSSGDAHWFDIKQDAGGLADIEFLVQYWVLSHAPEHPELLRWSDNIRQIEALQEAGVLAAEDASFLHSAYVDYRARIHHLALDGRPGRVPVEEVAALRDRVVALWEASMGTG
ncbi:MAG: bifunctional [glutamate--ammonia ligase]-adenylyl-L-tyrosine phosphorylase/[glutamate--ammonia-ligase] adenylyltransferase [Gammaproteobacteria bacterium]